MPAAFEQGHCYEPFVKYGNFTASDPRYPVGTTVEFSCDPGYTLEQGSTIIECVDPSDPQWNETEPACRGGRWGWGGLELGVQWVLELGGAVGVGVGDAGATVPQWVLDLQPVAMVVAGAGMLTGCCSQGSCGGCWTAGGER